MKVGASRRFGVPPLGGEAHANTIVLKIFHALVHPTGLPAEAGTPNLDLTQFQSTRSGYNVGKARRGIIEESMPAVFQSV
ncbi:MAG: hypothetical protein JWM68_1742 [Verrucomicrobiales bacterium]|nr:hypothetical protein [Verrucomicrobiales bacterium]